MNFYRWLEGKFFIGKVIKDYGPIYKTGSLIAGETHTLLLCHRNGKDWIVLRRSLRAVIGFSITHTSFPAEMAGSLAEKFIDIAARHRSEALRNQ